MSENKKYELLEGDTFTFPDGITLKRIRALKDIELFGVKAGDLGGYIESEANLSTTGNAWVSNDAKVRNRAYVHENAHVFENALISDVARIFGNSQVFGRACVFQNGWVYGNAKIYGDSKIFNHSAVYGDAEISGDTYILGNSQIYDDARISHESHVGFLSVSGNANNALTWFKARNSIKVTLGGFNTLVNTPGGAYGYGYIETLDEFEKALCKLISDAQTRREYKLLIDFIRLRSADFTYEGGAGKKAEKSVFSFYRSMLRRGFGIALPIPFAVSANQ